ncbi:MAG TPA: GNAT family N-acetyltransferase [Pyrinomonadaceae bacterium]|nr:GNAT family N-acetyltransferase [Pyrinomonadaceae bacterium]
MKAEVNVRLATATDAEAISNVLREAFTVYRDHYTAEAFEVVTPNRAEIARRFEEGPIWVAEVGGEVVGTVSVTTEPEGLYVRSMAVGPNVQGRGVGHRLLDAVDEYAADTEFERIFLYTTYFVPGAKGIYEKHGFQRVRDTTADEWYGTPGLEMDKELKREKQNVVGS